MRQRVVIANDTNELDGNNNLHCFTPTHVSRYDLSRSQWPNESHMQALSCDRRVPNLERRRLAVVAKDVQGRGIEQEVLAVTCR